MKAEVAIFFDRSGGLSFEVQDFFRESTSADTLKMTPLSEPCAESEMNEKTGAKVPSTWLAFKVSRGFDRTNWHAVESIIQLQNGDYRVSFSFTHTSHNDVLS